MNLELSREAPEKVYERRRGEQIRLRWGYIPVVAGTG
jgi:hypothetical protein